MPPQAQGGLAAALRARAVPHLGAKVRVWLGLAVGICVPYFLLQHAVLWPPQRVPVTPLDGWVAFDPRWVWPYASLALLVPLAPLLALRRSELRRYAVGLALLCAACFATFLLFPVEGPRPAVPVEGLYGWIVSVDRPSNSLPSLHAGLTVYSLLFGWRVLRDGLQDGGRRRVLAGAWLWGGLILYSTLATKQHWLVDLPAGALVAWGAHALAWRRAADRVVRSEGAPIAIR